MSVGTPDLLLEETEVGAVDLVADEIQARSPWELFFRRFREDKFALAGLIFLTLLILVAIFAPLVASWSARPVLTRRIRTRSTSSASQPGPAPPISSGSTRSVATCSVA